MLMFRFRLDGSSGVPPYLQLVHQVRQSLLLGYLRAGDRLPTVKEVAGDLALNPNTVVKAYRQLEHEGLAGGSSRQHRVGPAAATLVTWARKVFPNLYGGQMRFTKLGHSCVRLDKDGAVLVIDPGTFSDAAAALDGASAVLVTHEHPDHLDADAIRAALSCDPGVTLWANQAICAQFTEFGDRVHEVRHGDALEVAGFGVHVYGVDHALIHPDIPLVVNTGFLVDGELFHPGDSFTVPEDPVHTLLLPISAPWLKAGDMIDYFRAVAPARGYAIHDAVLNDNGLGLFTRMMSVAAAPSGVPVSRLEPGTTVDL